MTCGVRYCKETRSSSASTISMYTVACVPCITTLVGIRWGLHLLSRLLEWDPSQRMTLEEAQHHAYFVGPYVSHVDGAEFATAKVVLYRLAAFRVHGAPLMHHSTVSL
jgi:hypothetical protein